MTELPKLRRGDRVFVTLPADPPIRFAPWRDTATVLSLGTMSKTAKVKSVKIRNQKGEWKIYRVPLKFCSLNPL